MSSVYNLQSLISRNDRRPYPWHICLDWMFQNLSAHPSLEIDFQTNFQTKGFDDSGNVTSGKVLSLVGQMHTSTSTQAQEQMRKNAPCSQVQDKMYTNARINAHNVHKRTIHKSTQAQDQMYTSATKVPCGFPQLTQTYQSWSALPLF